MLNLTIKCPRPINYDVPDMERKRPSDESMLDKIRLYTCMVGPKPTHASFYVNEVAEVGAAIAKMAGIDDPSAQDVGDGGGVEEGQAGEDEQRSAVQREGKVLDAPGG